MNSAFKEIKTLILSAEKIAVAGHTSPDGDAVAAALSLCACISKLGKRPFALLEDYPERYNLIKGREFLYKGDLGELSPDLFISVDCADIKRLGKTLQVFENSSATVNIDHHASNDFFAGYNLVEPEASSASEMVYGLIKEITEVDKDIAAAVYAGIVFDTGGFRYSSTSPETMETIAELMRFGIPFASIYSDIRHSHSFSEGKVLALALGKMEISGGLVYSFLSRKEMESVNSNSSELESVIEYMIDTRGAEIAVFAYEKPLGEVKISLRSKEIDISKAAVHFGGGGHKNAAGCSLFGTEIKSALDSMLEFIRRSLKWQ